MVRSKVAFWAVVLLAVASLTGSRLARRLGWTLVGIWLGMYLVERQNN